MNCSFSYAKFGCVGLNRRDLFGSNIVTFSDYYPFGMVMPERNGGSSYRYSFQGQEKDDEIKGKGNSVNYKYRMHDTRLGRFFAVDPLAPDYPHNSPYAFSENRLIDAIELEGLEKYIIHQRSFAPWVRFGDIPGITASQKSFTGDARPFSLARHSSFTPAIQGGVSSRIYQKMSIDMGAPGGSIKTESSQTVGYPMFLKAFSIFEVVSTAKPSGEGSFSSSKSKDGTLAFGSLKATFEGSDPLVYPAPDIEWGTTIDIFKNNNVLKIEGSIQGKGFPAYEMFIEDNSGKKVFFTYFSAPDRLNLGSELSNPFWDIKQEVLMEIDIDKKGNFTGDIRIGHRLDNGILWTSSTIEEFNNSVISTPASSDCPDGDC